MSFRTFKISIIVLLLCVASGSAFASMLRYSSVTRVATSSCVWLRPTGTVQMVNICTPKYRSGSVTCHDNAVFSQSTSTCLTSTDWTRLLQSWCNGHTNTSTGKTGVGSTSVSSPCEDTFTKATAVCGTVPMVVTSTACVSPATLVGRMEAQCGFCSR